MAIEPVASYRLQLTPAFGFDEAIGVLDHVDRLGISHLYLSPIAEAVPGSPHGYDVVDHTVVRAELGGADGFGRLLDAVADRAMAVLLDHVPNHVATSRPELNPRWWELLRDGREGRAAEWFDVDWEVAEGRVILPVLGDGLDRVMADGRLVVDDDCLVVHGSRRLPLAPGSVGLPMDELLAAQHYRLQHWRQPDRNVRRFFTIDDLVAVRVERPGVAETVDAIPARYAGHPAFGGVRVDHVDGLADPEEYLSGLRARIGEGPLLLVEKILAPGERLPASWPVDGTTGYDFARAVDHVLLAAEARPVFDRRWRENTATRPELRDRSFDDLEHAARLEVVDGALAPDLHRVTRLARAAVPDADPVVVASEIRRLTTELPRYRTYLPRDDEASVLIAAISSGPVAAAILDPSGPAQVELRTRWQQLTGPVMAKGAEDRAFYRYLRLASLCEVGGDPQRFGIDVESFHDENLERLRRSPRSMSASSTHDTKRSEDVRARSAALTWRVVERRYPLPNGSYAAGDLWADISRSWGDDLAARSGVDEPTVSLAVETVVTVPGVDAERLTAYLVKACREAALHTDWEQPDADYEQRLGVLAELALTTDPESALGLDAVAPGISLAATALRLTSPGFPDVYQGSEAFTHRLVDPDNRVPPDWTQLERFGREDRTVADLWAANDPAVKTVLVRTLLELRRRRHRSFGAPGTYRPIVACAGAIVYGRGEDVVVAVRRGLAAVDGAIELPPGSWYDVLDPAAPTLSGPVEVASLIGSGADLTLPVAVFERD